MTEDDQNLLMAELDDIMKLDEEDAELMDEEI
jgi:hypothetical protein